FSWLALNTLLFWRTFSQYYSGPQYYYLHQMLGIISRKTRRLLHKYKSFHAACGITICVFSAVHVGAHIINAVHFSTNYHSEYIALNAARYKNEDPRKIIFTSVPGITGVLMVLILFLMSTASTASIRASNFDIFLHTHNLFFIFYLLLLVHASGGVLKYQTNLEEHPPGCLQLNRTMKYYAPLTELNGEAYLLNTEKVSASPSNAHGAFLINNSTLRICTKDPAFHPHFPETWLWISAPLCLYCAERLYRYFRSNKPVTITSVIHHPCNVIEIRMIKDHFKAKPGQCPTMTKATFAVHIKIVGDWTERLYNLLTPQCDLGMEIIPIFQHRKNPKIYIDGPFGSPSEEALNYEVSLCIAGGIGVTPYACILNQLLDQWREYKLQRLYFVWICRDIQAFLWFADLLCILHKKLWQENRPDYLNIQLYLSQSDGIQKIIGEKYQALNSRLIIGRPRWKLLFDEIAKSNRQKSVGVFCCGPKGLSKDLHKLCNRPNAYGTRFEYNKESFS
ncbi:hypothetical protein GDO78_015015, partial [Eleutherodactylus coqui]